MGSEDLEPRNIVVNRSQGPLQSVLIATFDLGNPGMEHEIKYEKYDSLVNGTIIISLDREEIFRISLVSAALGKISESFEIQRERIGLIEMQGFVAGVYVKVSINGKRIFRI